ncbi:MAG TPA: PhnD/SsuA/transferrin family substrate-binding protein [Polyangiaceae bacterium]|nr:PhnD/SsuA/transferrin family substrate-binding protein [Polyangiaceae bacterium]
MTFAGQAARLGVVAALVLLGCSRHEPTNELAPVSAQSASEVIAEPAEPGAGEARDRSLRAQSLPREQVLRLALISSQPAEAVARYGRLIDWLAERAGYEAGDLVVHDSADHVIGKLCDGGADLLLESVYPVVVAMLGCHALPVAVAAKGNSYRYSSTVVVRPDSDVQELEDLGGRDILFEDDRSTSGYLVPRSMLEQVGLAVEPSDQSSRAGAVRYRFGREEMNLVGWVVHGLATAAAISDQDLANFAGAELRIIARSEPLPRQTVALSPALGAGARERISAALLAATAGASDALRTADTAGFVELNDDDRAFLERMRAMVPRVEKGP